ncbi:MAG: hypothetical protein ACYDEX_13030 [Mobilitalea sp.]
MKKYNKKQEYADQMDKQEYANQMEVTTKKILKVIGFVILGIVVVIGFGFVVKGLWNWLMPELFGLKVITYWQGLGVLILAKIFFGGIGGNTSSKNSDSISGEVKGAVGQALHEGMQQGFYKEYDKKHSEGSQEECEKSSTLENLDQEMLYEKWWEDEGERKFEDYLKKINEEESL